MQEYLALWKNYLNFSDRTNLRGYWMAFLFNFLIGLGFGILISVTGSRFINWLSGVYSLAAFLPGLAIAVRRLRDAGKAWQWLFIGLIPLIGEIWLIVLFCRGSVPDDGTPVV
jgi:uncharacterized membrane protein YhaH (DUF805 family)